MKKLTFMLSFMITLATIPAQARGTIISFDKTEIIFSRIQKNMHVPQNMKNVASTERVRVVFTIDEKGKAHVMDVNTKRPDLKASVISQFEAIDFTDVLDSGNQEFSIWLTFKVM